MRFLNLLAAAAAIVLFPAAVSAQTLPTPGDNVILTISGAIDNHNVEDTAQFDLEGLDALGTTEVVTTNPWYDGPQTYTGVLGTDLLKAVGAHGTTLKIKAINDFVAEVPVADFEQWPVIFATRQNGEPMRIRDKGPIFLIYPFTDFPELDKSEYLNRSAWQIKSIEVQ